ncbi:hypothetical protein E4U54_003116 [Claviceps lovelessii]|nr:hypothetical protein E4U54_003116 [Claviceps lovelessii]
MTKQAATGAHNRQYEGMKLVVSQRAVAAARTEQGNSQQQGSNWQRMSVLAIDTVPQNRLIWLGEQEPKTAGKPCGVPSQGAGKTPEATGQREQVWSDTTNRAVNASLMNSQHFGDHAGSSPSPHLAAALPVNVTQSISVCGFQKDSSSSLLR